MTLGVLTLLIFVAIIGSGILMIVKSRKKGSPFPSCGQCGYDVTGTLGTAVRCPECGAAFAQAGIRAPGTKTNAPLMAAGIVMLLFGGGCLGSSVLTTTYALRRATAAQRQAIIARQQAVVAQQQADQAALDAQEATTEAQEIEEVERVDVVDDEDD